MTLWQFSKNYLRLSKWDPFGLIGWYNIIGKRDRCIPPLLLIISWPVFGYRAVVALVKWGLLNDAVIICEDGGWYEQSKYEIPVSKLRIVLTVRRNFFFFFKESFNICCLLLMITFYHQIKTSVSFWYRQWLNLKSLIQLLKILLVMLIETHKFN